MMWLRGSMGIGATRWRLDRRCCGGNGKGIELLRDATLEDLEACREKMSPESFARCRHIITREWAGDGGSGGFAGGDMERFGKLMVEAHASMRDDFAASCR